ncbi:hypothetical protein [Hymenobacter latericus]|uniref:hypothetical protein n=1 Tax=Hymenobacter sp. YIM 151858-1 TaxID=2987688 RepID=UPI0022275B58|nr:hypothetical protein [Hymenobacter sp. YIM 151858-1]UYZ60108.1 hypothetical protein OIS50_04730 [Hymenobacter sp. YIM 151858-1]
MPITRRTFLSQDTDTDASLLPATAFRQARNLFLERGFVTGAWGNRPIGTALPTGQNTVVGACWDAETQALYYLVYNADGQHGAYRYRPEADQIERLLQWSGLSLPSLPGKAQPCVTDGFLLFLDAAGEVRNLPIARCLSGYYNPVLLAAEPFCLHLLKVPPLSPPSVGRVQGGYDPSAYSAVMAAAWQFALRYRYLDGETTILSPYSNILPPLAPTDAARGAVQVTWPQPPQGVLEVEVLVRKNAETAWQIADTLRRTGNTLATSYTFAGATSGAVLSADEAGKTAEALWPAEALAVARNRAWVANLREGYVTPQPALSVAVADFAAATATNVTRRIFRRTVVFNGQNLVREYAEVAENFDTKTGTYLLVGNTSGLYYPLSNVPYTYNQAFVNYGAGETAVQGIPNNGTISLGAFPYQTSAPATAGTQPTWHEKTRYRVGIQFRDALGRPGGVGAVQSVEIPAQTYDAPKQRVLRWSLPSGDQSAVIPAWAATYQLVVSRNERVGFFRQLRLAAMWSNVSTNADKSISYAAPGLSGAPHLWLDIRPLASQGSGYVWASGSGDRVRFVDTGADLPIVGQQGDYLLVPWTTAAFGTSRTPRIEIYSPVTAAADVFYETGPSYRIDQQGAQRAFAVTTADLTGESWLVQRERYTAVTDAGALRTYDRVSESGGWVSDYFEAVSPSKEQPGLNAGVERGRVAVRLPDAQQQTHLPNAVRFSLVRLAGTQTNGLSSWEPLNLEDQRVPREIGPVTALCVADDTQAQGSLLVALCRNGLASIGLGVSQARQTDGGALLVEVDRVIGFVNTLNGGFGCQDAQTVSAHGGKVYFFDRTRQEWCRYAQNGVTPLGQAYNCKAAVRQLAASGLTGAAYDPVRDEALLLTPLGAQVFRARSEAMAGIRSLLGADAALGTPFGLFSWQNAVLHRHDRQAPRCTYFGLYNAPEVTVESAEAPGTAKRYNAVAVESARQGVWAITHLSTDFGHRSRTRPAWYEYREGVWRAALKNNYAAPGFASEQQALIAGPPVQGQKLTYTLTAPTGGEDVPLTACSVSWKPLSGQTMGQV